MTAMAMVVAAVVVLASYVTWLARRIDRLYARVEAAYSALDAALVRRATAAVQLATHAGAAGGLPATTATAIAHAAEAALTAAPAGREGAENDLSRALQLALAGPSADWAAQAELRVELGVAATTVGYARQFHNDAVRDTRALRFQRMPRLLGLSRGLPLPRYFEIADPTPPTRSPLAA